MRKLLNYFLAVLYISCQLHAQPRKKTPEIPASFCISAGDLELYEMISNYRQENGLSVIPLSASLSYVAYLHVRDLHQHRPDLLGCNLHSWSNRGAWTPCCYAKDQNRNRCMREKPRELTPYKGEAQEVIFWENTPNAAYSALEWWKSIDAANQLFTNQGAWTNKKWNALGVAVYQGYVSVWFGELADPVSELFVCNENRIISGNYFINKNDPLSLVSGPGAMPGSEPFVVGFESDNPPNTRLGPDTISPLGQINGNPANTPAEAIKLQDNTDVTTPVAGKPAPTAFRHYLVVSSFKTEAQANTEVRRLVSSGYTDAKVIISNGNYRVSLFDFQDKSAAQAMQQELKSVFKGIWILEQ